MANHDGLVLLHKFPPLDHENIVEIVSVHEPSMSRVRDKWLEQVDFLGHITMIDGVVYYPVAIVYSPEPQPEQSAPSPAPIQIPKGRKIVIKGRNGDGEKVK